MDEQVIYLIRHGDPIYPVDLLGRRLIYGPTAGLTDKGILKSTHLARNICKREGSPLEILVTSPYPRASQTAAILAREMGIKTVHRDDRLRDTRSSWEGILVDDFMAIFQEGKTFDDPHTLETIEELGERMKEAYDEIVTRFAGKSIGMIGHGDPIRALYFRLCNPQAKYPPYPDLTKMISLDSAEGIRIQKSPSGRLEWRKEIISGG
jgi:broad specificity phosphatase PhoE